MKPALMMTLLCTLFVGTHIGLATRRVRAVLVARLGEAGFMVFFSFVAAASFSVLVSFYAAHRFEGVAGVALAGVPAAHAFLMGAIVLGVVLTVAGLVSYPASPYDLFRPATPAPRGVERITRHPFFAGVALFAVAHALLATRLIGTIFFGGLAFLAIAGPRYQDAKLLARRGQPFADHLATTSFVPFVAILAGRQRMAWRDLPLAALAGGLVLAVILRTVHGSILAYGGVFVITSGLVAFIATLPSWWRARRASRSVSPPAVSVRPVLTEPVSRRRALACAGAMLLGYVGLVHEVVGATLYPDGPASFGGPLGWHVAGLSLVALGMLLIAGTLGVARVPVVPLAAIAGVGGALVVLGEAVAHHGFHFFAFTIVLAGALIVVAAREGNRPGARHIDARQKAVVELTV
ncbi:MAG: hypothetical protein HY271_01565 [Deltaproteobacteria bacterium]|nr:hypothetical protein [Deltaproteobacteria bacterium]